MKEVAISSIQRQFVVNSRLFADSPVYNIASLLRLEGPLDEPRLESAWRTVYGRSDILASSSSGSPAPWTAVAADEETVGRLAAAEANQPFDLDSPLPLVRTVLYRSAPELRFFLTVFHHSVTDLFSKDLMARQLSQAYNQPGWAPDNTTYSRFIEAEAAFLAGPAGVKARAWWEAKMSSPPPVLKLPSARIVQKPFRASGRRISWSARDAHTTGLDALADGGRSPFLVLLTAYSALLSRLSGQASLMIGVPLANRLVLGDAPVSGPTVNLLPVFAQIGAGNSFGEVYGQVRGEMLGNHRHQGLPFLEVAGMYRGAERDPLRPWVVQAGFTSEPPYVLTLDGITCRPLSLDRRGAQMDLFFTWWKGASGYEGYWEYNDDSFGEAEVRLWQQAFDRLLEEALFHPDSTVGSVALVSGADEKQLTHGAERAYPLERTMGDLLRDSYESHAQDTALVWRGAPTSYQDFSAGVAKVAAKLRSSAGIRGRVAVLLERGPGMLYALHGAVHSGNAYVPLGIDWPVARIKDILDDIQPDAVLTQAGYTDRFAGIAAPVFLVDEIVAGPAASWPPAATAPDDAMYILFTSGTTGRPKGAELPHNGIVNRLLWMQEEYRLLPGEKALLKTPYTFDVSGWELFWPHLAGAALVIAEERQHQDPREILNLIEQQGVRIVHFVPSMLSHFLDSAGPDRAPSLQDVVCSGEALTPELVSRFLRTLPGRNLHNLYGPTEASIDVSYWPCSASDVQRGTVPIGRPIANTQIYVLDEAGRVCPPLVRGEIFLGGVGLAKGYWNRPELTAEKFVLHPFGLGRLYRTGDWGRWGLDGAVEYLERRDNQVKIRGMRVELGEIETLFRNLPSIENVVVQKGKTPAGSDCLIAFYVSRDGADLAPESLRTALGETLPLALMPEVLIRLDALPRSENGKIDRKALSAVPLPAFAAPSPSRLEGPEAKVSQVWSEVLGHSGWSSETSFFDAGGSSLGLIALRPLLEGAFGRPVTIAQLFQNPTIAAMARFFSAEELERTSENTAAARAAKQHQAMAKLKRRV